MRIYLLLVLGMLIVAPAQAQEARCTELDTDGDSSTHCGCSETFDTTDNPGGNSWDPTNSPNSSECSNRTDNPNPLGLGQAAPDVNYGDGQIIEHVGPSVGKILTVPASSVDVLLSGVSRVLQITVGASGYANVAHTSYEFTNATVCGRWYVNWENDTWPTTTHPSGCSAVNDIKTFRWQTKSDLGSGPELQSSMITGGFTISNAQPNSTSPIDINLHETWKDAASPANLMSHCRDKWCGVEVCVSHNSRTGADANKYVYRAKLWQVGGPLVSVYPTVISTSTFTSAWTGRSMKMPEWSTPSEDWTGCGGVSLPVGTAHTYFSHVMLAFKSHTTQAADEAFEIGTADEIEQAGPTWLLPSITLSSASCAQGAAACNDIDVTFAETGTATGTINRIVDCNDANGAPPNDTDASLSNSTPNSTIVDACDFSALGVGVYNVCASSTRASIVPSSCAAFTVTGTGPPPELRCQELGSYCACSEPLNTTGAITQFEDFADSTTKQCNAGNPIWGSLQPDHSPADAGTAELNPPGDFAYVADTAAQSGDNFPSVTTVLQATHETAASAQLRDANRSFTKSTYCLRWYQQFSTGWSDVVPRPGSASGDDDIKGPRFQDFQGLGINEAGNPDDTPFLGSTWITDGLAWGNPTGDRPYSNWTLFSYSQAQPGIGYDLPPNNWISVATSTGEGANFADCQGHWCRVEICMDHNSRAAPNNNQLVTRARTVKLRMVNGVMTEVGRLSYPAQLSDGIGAPTANIGRRQSFGAYGDKVTLAEWGTPDWTGGFPHEGEKSWVSHIMVAIVPESAEGTGTIPANREKFWIGPAQEIEGTVLPSLSVPTNWRLLP